MQLLVLLLLLYTCDSGDDKNDEEDYTVGMLYLIDIYCLCYDDGYIDNHYFVILHSLEFVYVILVGVFYSMFSESFSLAFLILLLPIILVDDDDNALLLISSQLLIDYVVAIVIVIAVFSWLQCTLTPSSRAINVRRSCNLRTKASKAEASEA